MKANMIPRLPVLLAFSAALAGCNGVMPASQAPVSGTPLAQKAFDPAGSWMAPSAAKSALLYVSDTRGSVDVFSYPAGNPVGILRGFRNPAGLCTDPAGDVYVVDTDRLAIYKYRHGGTKPVKTLLMFGYYPVACAVDPKTGNVAVANYTSASQGPGAVSIFKVKDAIPSTYTDTAVHAFFYCSYDDHSNVIADGVNSGSSQTEFAELANGSSTLSAVTVDKAIKFPGGVQWDGSDLAVQDTLTRILYRFKMTGSHGKSAGTVQFDGDKSTLIHQFWISGKTIVMPYGTVSRHVGNVGFWNYPGGGALQKSLTVKRAAELVGITISR